MIDRYQVRIIDILICDKLFVTSHPVLRSDNATKDIQNIPSWISNWLKKLF